MPDPSQMGPNIAAITSMNLASVGANPMAGSWVSNPINRGAQGYTAQGKSPFDRPMPGFFGIFASGGGNTQRGSWVQKLAASIREDMAKMNSAGAVQAMPVREASITEITGSTPSWVNYVSSRGSGGGGIDLG